MTERADAAARAARLIGGRLYMYVTGDPGADDIAEYLAQGWIQAHDNYGEGESDTRVALDLTSSLQHLASALDRLAHDISTDGIGQVAELREHSMTPELKDLEAAILAYGHGEEDVRAWLAVDRIRARVLELEPLVAFGGGLGAVYAAEIQGLLFALNLLGEGE